MKKKILLIRNTPYDASPSSYNIQEIGIGKAFCRLGYDYDHVCFKKNDQNEWVFYEINGCQAKYIEKPRRRFLRWGYNGSLLRKDFLDQYDVIISREYYQIMTYLLSKNSGKVSMYSGPYYNLFMFKFFSPIYDFLLTKKLNKNLNGKFVKSVLAKEFMEKKGYTDVVNVGVGLDTERFDNETEIKPETQRIVDFMTQNKCILYVGALSDRKNFPFMLRVYEKALEKIPDLKFVVIGKSTVSAFAKLVGIKDVAYEKKCLSKFPQCVKNGIFRVERVDNPQLKFIYPHARAFLLPSKLEIFGMVLLEALYLGAPVISSSNGGSKTIIEGKNSGIVIDKFDVDLWANAVIDLTRNEELARSMVKNGQTVVKNEYSWDSIAKKMLEKIFACEENGR